MTNNANVIKILVTLLTAIQEAQLNKHYRTCLTNQAKAHALSLRTSSESGSTSVRSACRSYLARQASRRAIRDHSEIHRIRAILNIQEHYPHHHRLMDSGDQAD